MYPGVRAGSNRDIVLGALEMVTGRGARPVAYSEVVDALRHVPGGRAGDSPADVAWRKTTATRELGALSGGGLLAHEEGLYRFLTGRAYDYWVARTLLVALETSERGADVALAHGSGGDYHSSLAHLAEEIDIRLARIRSGLDRFRRLRRPGGPPAAGSSPARRPRTRAKSRDAARASARGRAGSRRPGSTPGSESSASAPSRRPRGRHRPGPL